MDDEVPESEEDEMKNGDGIHGADYNSIDEAL